MREYPIPSEKTKDFAAETLRKGTSFLEHFAVQADPLEDPLVFIESLGQLDPRFQGGRDLVRWQLEEDQTEWDEDTKEVIYRTAESMGMTTGETPLTGSYDAVIILGGARQANLDRARYAMECAKGGRAEFGSIIVAGSNRKLNEAEQANTANYAPGAKTEYDLCVGAAKVIAMENPGTITSTLYVEGERAGTPIVIQEVLKALVASKQIAKEASIAAVTTQIYQESTEMDLARVSKSFGVEYTFAAGNPSDPNVAAKRTPATYMTEIIRTLKAATLAAKED